MGALATAWQVRLSTQSQINLTNDDDGTATSVNATRLAAAETDATNAFLFQTGIDFDSTNSEHITLGCLGVTYFLYSYRGLPKSAVAEAARDEFEKACAKFNRTRGGLTWQLPQTNSNLNPTQDQAGALPRFDRRVLDDLVPRAPLTGSGDEALDFGRGT